MSESPVAGVAYDYDGKHGRRCELCGPKKGPYLAPWPCSLSAGLCLRQCGRDSQPMAPWTEVPFHPGTPFPWRLMQILSCYWRLLGFVLDAQGVYIVRGSFHAVVVTLPVYEPHIKPPDGCLT